MRFLDHAQHHLGNGPEPANRILTDYLNPHQTRELTIIVRNLGVQFATIGNAKRKLATHDPSLCMEVPLTANATAQRTLSRILMRG